MNYIDYENDYLIFTEKTTETTKLIMYKILDKYKGKIPKMLLSIKFILYNSVEEADNSLVFIGKYTESGLVSYFYGDKHYENLLQSKLHRFLYILKIKDDLMRLISFKRGDSERDECFKLFINLVFLLGIRTGREKHYRLRGTIGLLTLQKNNIIQDKSGIIIEFLGKKKILYRYLVTKKNICSKVIELLNRNKDNSFFFTFGNSKYSEYYLDEDLHKLKYDIKIKDIRTFLVNDLFLRLIFADNKLKPIDIIKIVSNQIQHTVAVCKKAYLVDIFYNREYFNSYDSYDQFISYLFKI